MNKKRTILVILAMMLVCVLSVAGTVAFLKADTSPVVNTFVAAGGNGPFVDEKTKEGDKGFEIKEYRVTQDESGKYTEHTDDKETDEVDGNSYIIMPDTVVPKHAFVRLSRTGTTKTTTETGEDGTSTTTTETIDPAPAYLYVEVINTLDLDRDVFQWKIDANNWQALTIENREVYLYKGAHCLDGTNVLTVVADNKDTENVDERLIDIIDGDQITVATSDTQISIEEGKDQIKFYAYLCQASINGTDDPTTVFTTIFPTKPE